jgi:DNA-binding Xre family transcriptional regulator
MLATQGPRETLVVPMTTLKIRLRELMREKTIRDGRHPDYAAITQLEVAKSINVAEGTLSSWARGTVARLDKDTIVKLCKYFDCRIEDLLQLED